MRTSSATNADGDSGPRQWEAIRSYAERAGLEVVRQFHDVASGADPVTDRPGFREMLDYIAGNGARTILIENASRFARDLGVQLAGHALLRDRGIELVPVDAPDFFRDPGPTAVMVRQILGSVSEFEKASLVAKLRAARQRIKAATGRCEGRKPTLVGDALALAKRLRRRNPVTGQRRSLREVAEEMGRAGFLNPVTGKPYSHEALRRVLGQPAPAKGGA